MTKPTSPYAGIDRTAPVESLQHVAAPVDVEQAVRQGIEKIRRYEGGPTDCRGEPLDLDHEIDRAFDRQRAARSAELLGPLFSTSADLLELDAVPEPVDGDQPRALHPPGCVPIGADEPTGRYQRPSVRAAR